MAVDTREFRAEARFQRVSPQKARLVLDLIKGQPVEQALTTIAFTKKGVAPLVEKVLRSALQNANYLSGERGLDIDVDNLYVKTAVANDGPRMKRIRPAPMGRAFRYQRRLSHIAISVAELAEAEGVEAADGSVKGSGTRPSAMKRLVNAAGAARKAAGGKKQSAPKAGGQRKETRRTSAPKAAPRKPSTGNS